MNLKKLPYIQRESHWKYGEKISEREEYYTWKRRENYKRSGGLPNRVYKNKTRKMWLTSNGNCHRTEDLPAVISSTVVEWYHNGWGYRPKFPDRAKIWRRKIHENTEVYYTGKDAYVRRAINPEEITNYFPPW